MRIASIETRVYRHPLDPPFTAAWDPEPRTFQEATVVVVRSDDAAEGYASGDAVPDRALLEHLLVGRDASDTQTLHELLETVDLHHGRNWIVEVAVWDLLGRARGEPVWRLLGGERDRILAYASSGELVDADERVRRCAVLRDAGLRAVKLRLHSQDWRLDVPVIAAVRERVPELQLMVDANQGWRMPGDLTPRWDLRTAEEFAGELEGLGVYWLEEPLSTDDVDGYAALAAGTDLRIAAGELVRTEAEAGALLTRGGVDVVQPDIVLSGGSSARDESRRSPRRWVARGAHTHGRTGTGCSRTCTPRSPFRRAPTWRSRSIRRRGRPSAATGSSPLCSRSRPTGRSRRRQALGSASRPTSRRSSDSGSADRARYCTSWSSLNIGMYIAITMIPMIRPTPIIMSGSMIEVSEAIDVSTSSS